MISEVFGDILAVTNIDLLASVVITGKHVDTSFAVSGATFLPCDSTHDCVSVGERHIHPLLPKSIPETICFSVIRYPQLKI